MQASTLIGWRSMARGSIQAGEVCHERKEERRRGGRKQREGAHMQHPCDAPLSVYKLSVLLQRVGVPVSQQSTVK
jgi:hypothetical protein